jgi:transcriptional/translational regulatory protein YebC/TACO1
MFNRKAVFEFEEAEGLDTEELELELIDAGLEEIELNEGMVYVYGDYTNFGTLSSALEEMKIDIKKAELQRIPTSPVDFTDEQLEEIEKMLDKIDEDDDVQNVFTNIN